MKIYAIIGSSAEVIDHTSNPKCPDGYIEMAEARPTPDHVAQENGTWAIPQPEPDPIPPSVTMRQARLALLGTGMLDAVSAGIEAMPGVDGAAARIEWEYAATVERDSPLINGLSVAIGMTDSQVDELFLAASKL